MLRSQERLGYVIAILGCAAILLIRLALDDVLGDQGRMLPFVLAVIGAAWWGGRGPGLFATFLGALLSILFVVPPAFSLWIGAVADAMNAGIFVVTGTTISVLCDALAQGPTTRNRTTVSLVGRRDASVGVDGAP